MLDLSLFDEVSEKIATARRSVMSAGNWEETRDALIETIDALSALNSVARDKLAEAVSSSR